MAGNPIIRAVADFVSVLDELGINYVALCTKDVDLVADLAPEQTESLASKLKAASAEDTVLEKLVWYKQGGQISDQQWSDVLGIATTLQLDREYLREWAPKLGVAELLEQLLGEAGQIHLA
jgi:hypothetical protein